MKHITVTSVSKAKPSLWSRVGPVLSWMHRPFLLMPIGFTILSFLPFAIWFRPATEEWWVLLIFMIMMQICLHFIGYCWFMLGFLIIFSFSSFPDTNDDNPVLKSIETSLKPMDDLIERFVLANPVLLMATVFFPFWFRFPVSRQGLLHAFYITVWPLTFPAIIIAEFVQFSKKNR